MYTLIRSLSFKQLISQQIPALGISLLTAEVFKFHSFALECAAFLATWYAVDDARHFGRERFRASRPA